MAEVIPGRFTALIDGPFVVFIIGMRVNRITALRRWVPTFLAMPRMLAELAGHPETGYLGGRSFIAGRNAVMIQYWRSFEELNRFARDPHKAHLPAWRRFNRAVGTDGSVGIWHESYLVGANQYETIYGNMPVWGLAAAGAHVAASGRRETTARRLGYADESTLPTQANSPLPDSPHTAPLGSP